MALQQAGTDPTYVLNEVISRLRSLESKHTLLSEQVLIINKNMISEYKSLVKNIQSLNSELRDTKSEIFKMKEAMSDMVKEMQKFARKDQVKLLEKYIDLWNPMHFVTEDEVKKIIRREKKDGTSSK